MASAKIVRVEWARLEGRRPRLAGNNSRISVHGIEVRPPIARVTADDGSSGFGWARATRDEAAALLGVALDDAFSPETGVAEPYLGFEYPIWDLMAKRRGAPAYELAAAVNGIDPASLPRPFRARCYDTSLYIDDLHLASDQEGAALIAKEAREGYDRGHRAFKIKVGRGARYMELEAGTRRDIAVIRAVREAVGPGLPILIDANNGYNLNLTKRVLRETADCDVFWMEEPFHEDAALYQDLHEWLRRESLATLIADGEGQASPALMDMAHDHAVDVIQYDVLRPGFTRWLGIGRRLDAWGAKAAPHHYGGHYGNYASCHLAAAVKGFLFAEWDEATTPGLDGSAYRIDEGVVTVPRTPGFGLELDDAVFRKAVAVDGFDVGA